MQEHSELQQLLLPTSAWEPANHPRIIERVINTSHESKLNSWGAAEQWKF